MLIRRAEVYGLGERDVRIRDGQLSEMDETLAADNGEFVLNADGGALLPGLHDHHLHLFSLAAARASAPCGPPAVSDRTALERAITAGAARANGGSWIRGVGYCESVAGPLDRRALDAMPVANPVRVQHRSGGLWILNSAAVGQLGLDRGVDVPGIERDANGKATGRLFGLDTWLRSQVSSSAFPDLTAVGRELAAFGVTGVTDASVDNDRACLDAFVAAIDGGALRQRAVIMGNAELPTIDHPRIRVGPVKIYLRDHALPKLEDLGESMRDAHGRGRRIAVHCVTRAELVLAATALMDVGPLPGDRIEHAAVAPPDLVALLKELAVSVVTQPHFIAERGDTYREDVDSADLPWLYRCAGWLRAGLSLAAGSDAPFGHPDPWRAMRAATLRTTESGFVLGREECISPEQALSLFTADSETPGFPNRQLRVGSAADVCLLDRPWGQARSVLRSEMVRATFCAGRQTFETDGA